MYTIQTIKRIMTSWLKGIAKRMDWIDISLIKLGAFTFGLLLAHYTNLELLPAPLLIVIILLAILRPMKHSFF